MKQTTPPKRVHHGDLRRAARDIGLSLVREGGAESLSMREVAARAGVTHRALYRHYQDREALLVSIAGAGYALAEERVRPAVEAAPGARRAFFSALVRFAIEEPRLYDVMFSLSGPTLAAAEDTWASMRAFTQTASRVYTADLGRPVTPAEVFPLLGMAHGLYQLWRAGLLRARDAEAAHRYIVEAIAASLSASSLGSAEGRE